MRKAAILTIGDELMIGQIVDSNSAWIAAWLDRHGWVVERKVGVRDDIPMILDALRLCHTTAELVITTGGLGPTKDDLTKDELCQYYQTEKVWHEETWQRVLAILTGVNRPPSEYHREQCLLPASALIVNNDQGSAPGMFFNVEGKSLIAVPGVPYVLSQAFQNHLSVTPFYQS